jgi:hypothetical protein
MEDTKVDNLRSKSLPSVRPGLYLWAEGDLSSAQPQEKIQKAESERWGVRKKPSRSAPYLHSNWEWRLLRQQRRSRSCARPTPQKKMSSPHAC